MKNALKEKLRRGEVVFGFSLGTPCLDLVEMLSRMPFDWIWFDTEHGPLNTEMLQPILQAARGGKATPVVRVPWNDVVHIKKALDVGAEGLIIPWVNSREQAEAAVRAAKYPPEGLRGFGPRWLAVAGADAAEYVRTANEEGFIMVQIETMEAVGNLEAILTTPGVDAYLIGPNDLAASMGHLGEPHHPDVEAVIEDVVRAGKRLGVPGGYAGTTIEDNKRRVAQGFQWITLGSDLGFAAQGATAALEAFGR